MTPCVARVSRFGSPRRRGGAARRGFTLIEVLATMLLMVILLPVIMEGISLASGVADVARRRNEAIGLAEMQLNNLLSTEDWNNGVQEGNFDTNGDDQAWTADYTWQADINAWPEDEVGLNETIYQMDVTVSWPARNGRDRDSVLLSTLVYDRYDQYNTYQTNLTDSTSSSTSSTGGTTAGG